MDISFTFLYTFFLYYPSSNLLEVTEAQTEIVLSFVGCVFERPSSWRYNQMVVGAAPKGEGCRTHRLVVQATILTKAPHSPLSACLNISYPNCFSINIYPLQYIQAAFTYSLKTQSTCGDAKQSQLCINRYSGP